MRSFNMTLLLLFLNIFLLLFTICVIIYCTSLWSSYPVDRRVVGGGPWCVYWSLLDVFVSHGWVFFTEQRDVWEWITPLPPFLSSRQTISPAPLLIFPFLPHTLSSRCSVQWSQCLTFRQNCPILTWFFFLNKSFPNVFCLCVLSNHQK